MQCNVGLPYDGQAAVHFVSVERVELDENESRPFGLFGDEINGAGVHRRGGKIPPEAPVRRVRNQRRRHVRGRPRLTGFVRGKEKRNFSCTGFYLSLGREMRTSDQRPGRDGLVTATTGAGLGASPCGQRCSGPWLGRNAARDPRGRRPPAIPPALAPRRSTCTSCRKKQGARRILQRMAEWLSVDDAAFIDSGTFCLPDLPLRGAGAEPVGVSVFGQDGRGLLAVFAGGEDLGAAASGGKVDAIIVADDEWLLEEALD